MKQNAGERFAPCRPDSHAAGEGPSRSRTVWGSHLLDVAKSIELVSGCSGYEALVEPYLDFR
jgi:hypothetical protein